MIIPDGMDVIGWTDQMSISLNSTGIVPRLDDPALWREWAVQVNLLDAVGIAAPPDPYAFDTWDEWARRFNAVLGD